MLICYKLWLIESLYTKPLVVLRRRAGVQLQFSKGIDALFSSELALSLWQSTFPALYTAGGPFFVLSSLHSEKKESGNISWTSGNVMINGLRTFFKAQPWKYSIVDRHFSEGMYYDSFFMSSHFWLTLAQLTGKSIFCKFPLAEILFWLWQNKFQNLGCVQIESRKKLVILSRFCAIWYYIFGLCLCFYVWSDFQH